MVSKLYILNGYLYSNASVSEHVWLYIGSQDYYIAMRARNREQCQRESEDQRHMFERRI